MNLLPLNLRLKKAKSVKELITLAAEIQEDENLEKHEDSLLDSIDKYEFDEEDVLALVITCQTTSIRRAILAYFAEKHGMEDAAALLQCIDISEMAENFVLTGLSPNINTGCLCPDCQIKILCDESPENEYLKGEWKKIKAYLKEEGCLEDDGEKISFFEGWQSAIENAPESIPISNKMRSIIFEPLQPREPTPRPIALLAAPIEEMGNLTVAETPMSGINPAQKQPPSIQLDDDPVNMLRAMLDRHDNIGDLATFLFPPPYNEYTLKELYDSPVFVGNLEILEVLREYVEKIEQR